MGNVLPPGVHIYVEPIRSTWVERGATLGFEIEIRKSIIKVECTVDSYDPQCDHSYFVDRAMRVTMAVVDPFVFREGVGLSVHLTDLIKPDGSSIELITGHTGLHRLCTAFAEDDPLPFQSLLLSKPFLAAAVHELVLAVSVPGSAPLHCGRALESLRRVIYPAPGSKRTKGWSLMQQELNFSKSYLAPISEQSKEIRHGSELTMDEAIVEDVLIRAWTVFNRYFEYLNRNSQRLSEPDFPRLD